MNATSPETPMESRAATHDLPAGADPLTPRAQGLYDPAREHDSCGVGFVADMKNRKSHAILEKGLQILVNLDHRGAVGADPTLGDGCGVLTQIPHAFLRGGMREARLHPAGARSLRHRPVLHAARRRGAGKGAGDRRISPSLGEGQTVLGWRDVPVESSVLGERVKAVEPVMQQIFIGRRRRHRHRGRFRAPTLHHPQGGFEPALRHQGPEARRVLSGVAVVAHHHLQGHGAGQPARALLPRPSGPALRDRAGAGASAVRHQHVSVLAPRASLSDGRAQRRDQHAARQPQLDGGAAGERRFRAVRQRHPEVVAGLLRGAVGHRLLRQRARVPGARRLFAEPRDDDADPGGLGGQSAHGRGAARLLRIPRRADGAVGRAGGGRLHRRSADRRDARPQRPEARALLRDGRRSRGARLRDGRASRSPRRASSPSGACSPARCCWSTSSSTASCPTPRSSSRCRARTPTPSG